MKRKCAACGRAHDHQEREAGGQHAEQRRECRPFIPPRNRIPNAVTAMTTNAPNRVHAAAANETSSMTEHRQQASPEFLQKPCLRVV